MTKEAEIQRAFIGIGAKETYETRVKISGELPFDKFTIGAEFFSELESGRKIHGFIINKEIVDNDCLLTIECRYDEWLKTIPNIPTHPPTHR